MALNWGIMSAGRICNDFVNALNHLPQHEHKIVAVAASNKEKADNFALKHKIPKAYGSYDEIVKDKSIDVIYVGSTNNLHYALSKMILESGKHLVCEKPLCLNVAHTKDLIKISKEKKLFLMEAVWSRCFPLYDELRKLLASNIIGDPMHLRAEFGLLISDVPRLKDKELGGGTVFDLGVYVLQLAILIFGPKPSSLTAIGSLNENGVDESINYVLKYDNGRGANLCTHSKVKLENSATIYGSKGFIKIKEPFWCPTALCVNNEDEIRFPLPEMDCEMNHTNSEGLIYEAMEVRECIKKGLSESPKMTHEETLAIAMMQEEVCKMIGYDPVI